MEESEIIIVMVTAAVGTEDGDKQKNILTQSSIPNVMKKKRCTFEQTRRYASMSAVVALKLG